MTIRREEAKELLPIIQALAEGKIIQDKIEGLTDWVDTDEINLEYNGQRLKHRIKPEPKYRPFMSKEECWQEMQKHQPFGWVKDKDGSYVNMLIVRDEEGGYGNLIESLTFADGTPFGINNA